jgi:hypothetical protein
VGVQALRRPDAIVERLAVSACKTQIEQGTTDRRALHVAQVLKLARRYGAGGAGDLPERELNDLRPSETSRQRKPRASTLAGAGALAVVAAGILRVRSRF